MAASWTDPALHAPASPARSLSEWTNMEERPGVDRLLPHCLPKRASRYCSRPRSQVLPSVGGLTQPRRLRRVPNRAVRTRRCSTSTLRSRPRGDRLPSSSSRRRGSDRRSAARSPTARQKTSTTTRANGEHPQRSRATVDLARIARDHGDEQQCFDEGERPVRAGPHGVRQEHSERDRRDDSAGHWPARFAFDLQGGARTCRPLVRRIGPKGHLESTLGSRPSSKVPQGESDLPGKVG